MCESVSCLVIRSTCLICVDLEQRVSDPYLWVMGLIEAPGLSVSSAGHKSAPPASSTSALIHTQTAPIALRHHQSDASSANGQLHILITLMNYLLSSA